MAGMRHNGRQDQITIGLCLLTVRLINSLSIATFFQPDEYFQSLEPAWQWAFSPQSGAWITWEWREGLRSSIHPLIFASAYTVADALASTFNASTAMRSEILIAAPKVVQACFAMLIDYSTYRLADILWPNDSKLRLAALALSLLNPWQWFCSVRTLSNCLETALTITALSFWPWSWFFDLPNKKSHLADRQTSITREAGIGSNLSISLTMAAVACILRPTNILIWIAVLLCVLSHMRNTEKVIRLMGYALGQGTLVLTASWSFDQWFYGRPIFPPMRFLYFNIVQSLAVFYGRNRSDYYFTEGLPLLLTTSLPFAVIGLYIAMRPSSPRSNSLATTDLASVVLHTLSVTVVASILVLSLISHKEVRFIYPLLPMLHVLAAPPLVKFIKPRQYASSLWRKALIAALVISNIFIAYYVGNVHQRGVIDVLHFLRHKHEAQILATDNQHNSSTVAFLMPCHSTPWRSHLVHSSIEAWALTCEPPLDVPIDARSSYLDEADIFYTNPIAWLEGNMVSQRTSIESASHTNNLYARDGKREWPQHVVFFDQLTPAIGPALAMRRYHECWRGFNTHWHDDRRRKGDVVVWCRNSFP